MPGKRGHLGKDLDTARPRDEASSRPPTPPSGPMTRAHAKALHDKVNLLLTNCDFNTSWDGILLHSNVQCVIRYQSQEGQTWTRSREEDEEEGTRIQTTAPGPVLLVPQPVLPPKTSKALWTRSSTTARGSSITARGDVSGTTAHPSGTTARGACLTPEG